MILKPCHTFAQSIYGNQASGEAQKDEEADRGVGFCAALPFSPAAARGVSGPRFRAPTRWLPDSQSQAPAGIMKEARKHTRKVR